jgi:hypothetical protein
MVRCMTVEWAQNPKILRKLKMEIIPLVNIEETQLRKKAALLYHRLIMPALEELLVSMESVQYDSKFPKWFFGYTYSHLISPPKELNEIAGLINFSYQPAVRKKIDAYLNDREANMLLWIMISDQTPIQGAFIVSMGLYSKYKKQPLVMNSFPLYFSDNDINEVLRRMSKGYRGSVFYAAEDQHKKCEKKCERWLQ